MPYIKQKDRERFESIENEVDKVDILTPGELNYLVTGLVKRYLVSRGHSYASYNDVMGALTGANLEFYRRVVALYEDGKVSENGDVY